MIMSIENRENRLDAIRKHLKRGDKKRIAELAGVHRVWVSLVIAGSGTSEPVLQIAEQVIAKRVKQN